MAHTEIHNSWPKHMVKPHDKRQPVNIHNTYLILLQGLVHCGCPELLNDYKQLDELLVEVRIIKNKGYQRKLKAEAVNPYRNLDYSGYHKN